MKLYISKLHYKKNPTLWEKTVIFFLWLLSIPYDMITSVRNFLYDKNLIKIYNPKVLTIAVGNLTTGGVGKTPFTAELANFYVKKLKKVAVLSRGYGGSLSNKEVNVISDGQKIYYDAKQAGDEPFWIASNCPSVVVLTCSSRAKAAEKAIKDLNCDVLIADDAFQHRKLGRHINIVLVDKTNKFGNEYLLPAGPLREDLSGMKRADVVVVTNKSASDNEALKYCDEIKYKFKKPVFMCKMIPVGAYNIKNNDSLYAGATVLAFCAIGQPKEFFEFVRKDYYLQTEMTFPDHHSYTDEDMKLILETAEKSNVSKIITTEKDAVKIKELIGKFKTDIKAYALKLGSYADIEDIVNVK